jgi:hypothetical protein
MLQWLIEAMPPAMEPTAAKIAKAIDRPRVSSAMASKLAESAIREMVRCGTANIIEAFIDELTLDRFRSEYDFSVLGADRDDARMRRSPRKAPRDREARRANPRTVPAPQRVADHRSRS